MRIAKYLKTIALAGILAGSTAAFASPAPEPDLKDLLGGLGGAAGKAVEGIFTKTDLTVADIAGEWHADGSAVSFQSENFLKKAGGMAAAGAVESKLDTYYKQFGLNNARLDIDKDGNCTFFIGKIPLKGTIAVKGKGVFRMVFSAFGGIKIGSMTTYIEKTPTGINVMFDADKIKTIMSVAAKISKSKMTDAADQLLQQYDGICIGFKMKGTPADGKKSATDTAIDALRGLFGK